METPAVDHSYQRECCRFVGSSELIGYRMSEEQKLAVSHEQVRRPAVTYHSWSPEYCQLVESSALLEYRMSELQ